MIEAPERKTDPTRYKSEDVDRGCLLTLQGINLLITDDLSPRNDYGSLLLFDAFGHNS